MYCLLKLSGVNVNMEICASEESLGSNKFLAKNLKIRIYVIPLRKRCIQQISLARAQITP